MSELLDHLEQAERAAAIAAAVIAEGRERERSISGKGDRDYATDIDYAVEDELRSFFAVETPDIPVLGEERGRTGESDSRYEWVVDPIDGTSNFAHGSPLFSVSIALTRDGEPVVGVVAAPATAEVFSAAAGHGAKLNGEPIAAADTDKLADAIVSIRDFIVGDDAADGNVEMFDLVHRLAPRIQRIRMIGSAALDLCWVAAGRHDATFLPEIHLWDIAGGVVIAREAGAIVMDRTGREWDGDPTSALACAPGLHRQFLDELEQLGWDRPRLISSTGPNPAHLPGGTSGQRPKRSRRSLSICLALRRFPVMPYTALSCL